MVWILRTAFAGMKKAERRSRMEAGPQGRWPGQLARSRNQGSKASCSRELWSLSGWLYVWAYQRKMRGTQRIFKITKCDLREIANGENTLSIRPASLKISAPGRVFEFLGDSIASTYPSWAKPVRLYSLRWKTWQVEAALQILRRTPRVRITDRFEPHVPLTGQFVWNKNQGPKGSCSQEPRSLSGWLYVWALQRKRGGTQRISKTTNCDLRRKAAGKIQ